MKTKLCVFCKLEQPATSFQKTRLGGSVKKCNQCKYKARKEIRKPVYVPIKEREKLKIERD